MTAGLRIYDPATGLVTLDTTDGLSRIVRIVDDDSTSGTITIPTDVIGGGTLFWQGMDQFGWTGSTFATVSGNTVSYTKRSDRTLLIGVYA